MRFYKMCILPKKNHYFSGLMHWGDQRIQATIDETTRWKSIENPYVVSHRFYQKSSKIQPKIKFPQAYPKKCQKSRFWDRFDLPTPSQNLSEIRRAAGSARRKSHSIYALINMDLNS